MTNNTNAAITTTTVVAYFFNVTINKNKSQIDSISNNKGLIYFGKGVLSKKPLPQITFKQIFY